VPGAYSEVAALAACPGWTHVPCNQFEQVFQVRSNRSSCRQIVNLNTDCGSPAIWHAEHHDP
jgi:hypothetical protein